MSGDLDSEMTDDEPAHSKTFVSDDDEYTAESKDYDISAVKSWPPPPPSNENKVVHQLDDVTRESEEKAMEVFDMLEAISNEAMSAEEDVNAALSTLQSNVELFDKLRSKFPQIATFEEQYEKNSAALGGIQNTLSHLSNISMNVMTAMDTMQYQDIHRQKIERVINIMRALSNYMNKLFEGKIDDEKRVSSAKHIAGDDNDDLAHEDDIEALIASFGNK